MNKKTIRIASFDIGKKNFGQYVGECDLEELQKLREKYKQLPKDKQRRVKGKMNDEIKDILNQLFLIDKRIQTGIYDLREDKTSQKLDNAVRRNLINHLDKYGQLWDTCEIFIIEQQFFRTWNIRGRKTSGSEANIDAIKMGEALVMWLMSTYPSKEVLYFGSQNKTLMLGAPSSLTKPKRKKWAVDKTEEIYRLRKDEDMIGLFDLKRLIFRKRLNSEEKIQGYLKTYKGTSPDAKQLAERIVRDRQKIEDSADALVQLQAFIYRDFVACF